MQTPNELILNSQSRRIKGSIFPVCFHGTSRLSGDLLDGFIPRLLREEHPDGVALKGVDRTKVSFRQWLKDIDGWQRHRRNRGIGALFLLWVHLSITAGGRSGAGRWGRAPENRGGTRNPCAQGTLGSGLKRWKNWILNQSLFFSFAHSEGSAFCTKRYWDVIFFSGMLCLLFHQLPPGHAECLGAFCGQATWTCHAKRSGVQLG